MQSVMHYAYHNRNNYGCKLNTTYLLCDYDVYIHKQYSR